MKPQTIIFFGSSGSGKGTQGKLLQEYFEKKNPERDVLYIETGQRFRDFIENDSSHTSALTKELLDAGGLLPVFLPVWVWTNYLVAHYTGEEHLILDGLSRRLDEAPVLDSALRFYRREDAQVLYLKTSYEWSKGRLLERNRGDDSESQATQRLDWFYENTVPAMNYFKNHASYDFHEIDGEQTVEEVHGDILKALELT